MKFWQAVTLAALVIWLTGCGTFSARMSGAPEHGVYRGVRFDAITLHDVTVDSQDLGVGDRLLIAPMALIDVPFSAIADTLLLPIDLSGK